jgi:hypothetical protein
MREITTRSHRTLKQPLKYSHYKKKRIKAAKLAALRLDNEPPYMSNHRLLLLILLVAYIFTPTLFNWIISSSGAWYRPFIIWIIIIAIAFSMHRFSKKS